MKITFLPLTESHFPLLLEWLEKPHVKAWWDQDVKWTQALIEEKYADYVKGYKLENGAAKTISAHVIYADNTPIGYIQIYNAYDFARGEPLIDLPASLAAFDAFIGDEAYLKQGIGSQAIAQFLKEHGTSYTHVFADPENTNIVAIRAYEKVGFKKSTKKPGTGEVWMILEQTARPDPLYTIQKLVQERYFNAKAIFWAGSVSQNQGTNASDLDLVIVFDAIPAAYREAFIYDGWPIDAFIHDIDTLRYLFEESRVGNGISGLNHMILNGRVVTKPNTFSENIKTLAREVLNVGPVAWDQEQIDKERFLITDVLDDIKYAASREEQIASAAWLFEALAQFYFRSQNKWCASGKSIIRYLKNDNPALASEFVVAFESLFHTGNTSNIESIVIKILAPYGGLLWNRFRSDASREAKISKPIFLNEFVNILEELKSREPIFHHPEKFGKTKQDIENQMCDEFWEVGASGNIYTKQDVIKTLCERYNDPNYQDIWEAKDFNLTQIAADNYLLTYILIQDKTRFTRRSTLWRRINGSWKILYHQGTVIDGGKE